MEIEGAVFINGVAQLSEGVLLACESIQDGLLRIDIEARSVSTWLADDRLTPSPLAPFLPGANGLKLFAGAATVTSNGRALLCRIPVLGDGSAGSLKVIAGRLRGDDMAFDVEGNCYIATHIGHSLDRVTADGTRVTLAGVDEGLAGSTACAFGLSGEDRSALFVTTTGGIIGPANGIVQPARLVRLDVGVPGASLGPATALAA